MAVLHDWVCAAHGNFESREGKCPYGCTGGMVSKVFLKPVGTRSERTKGTDNTLRQLALDFKMTDMNNRGGDPVAKPDSQAERRVQEFQAMMAPKWGVVGQGANAVPSALSGIRAEPGSNVLAAVKDALEPPRPLVIGSSGSKADIK